MTEKIIKEFIDTVDGVVKQISGDEPENDSNVLSSSNKTSDEVQPAISAVGMTPWNSAFGLGYMTGTIMEGEDKVAEQVLSKKVSALDLLKMNEEAPDVSEDDDAEYVEKTKYFIEVFNNFFDDEEKVKSIKMLFEKLFLSDIDDRYKKSLLNLFKDKLFN